MRFIHKGAGETVDAVCSAVGNRIEGPHVEKWFCDKEALWIPECAKDILFQGG